MNFSALLRALEENSNGKSTCHVDRARNTGSCLSLSFSLSKCLCLNIGVHYLYIRTSQYCTGSTD